MEIKNKLMTKKGIKGKTGDKKMEADPIKDEYFVTDQV